MMKIALLCTAMYLLMITATSAQPSEAAARIKAKVEEMGLKFVVSETGNYKFTFGLENDRSQLVFIRKEPSTYLDVDYVWVYAPVMEYATPDQFPKQTLIDLMAKNGTYKLGWFELVNDKTSSTVYFSNKIPLSATAVRLYSLLMDTARGADKAELTYTAKDQF